MPLFFRNFSQGHAGFSQPFTSRPSIHTLRTWLVIHDTGAHGFAMGYNYNGKLKSAELLLKEDGSVQMIRRAETPQDYFATLDVCPMMEKYLK